MALLAKLLWVLLIVACSEVGPSDMAPLTVVVTDFFTGAAVQGARLCEMDTTDNCVDTDADGEATLLLPIGWETGYTRDKEGYAPWLIPVVLSEDGAQHVVVMPRAEGIAGAHAGLGSPYPMRGTGSIGVGVSPPFTGATVRLVAATGVRWYMDEEWNWNPNLGATTIRGIGGFTEVTPGVVQVTVGGTADQCVPSMAWPDDAPNTFRVPVRERYVTMTAVNCVPP